MAKPEWGIKRVCQSCAVLFYDFFKSPIVCPKCSATFDPEAVLKSRRNRVPIAEEVKPARPKVAEEAGDDEDEDEEEDGLVLPDEDEDEEEEVLPEVDAPGSAAVLASDEDEDDPVLVVDADVDDDADEAVPDEEEET
ncbi:MAG: TIGR02300 family protein [Proteobacteria bacterium]|nr:TIGR02300 family protein [Pseudomonadota bacterium]